SVREAVRSEGAKVRTVADFFLGLFNRRQKEVKKKKTAK
ncbi:MAG: hypothetical protein UT80_C0019G0014, partial [Parcubacteria group bacterium GW2011_GWC1_40_13]